MFNFRKSDCLEFTTIQQLFMKTATYDSQLSGLPAFCRGYAHLDHQVTDTLVDRGRCGEVACLLLGPNLKRPPNLR